jgi:hypothetical protein
MDPIRFRFKHMQFPGRYVGCRGHAIRGRTTCIVHVPGYGHRGGAAECSASDRYVKAVGRKVALTRALADIPRSIRKGVWEAYHQYIRGHY